MPEKPTEKGNAYHHWLFDEINILSEILGDRLRESRIVRRSKSIDWESVTEGYNDRFNVCFQEKGVLMRDGESELREGRSAPNRTRQEIKMISSNDPRLSSIVAEYNDLKKKIDNDISEDSSQVEVYEEDQSPPRMFKWKGVRYIDNNDRTEAEVNKPDKSKTIIETSGIPLKGEKAEPSLTYAWSWDERHRLANILTKRTSINSLRKKNYSGVDFSSVFEEFNDTLNIYRSETQIKRFAEKNNLSKFTDDYIEEENKRRIDSANDTASAFASKRPRISSSGSSQ
ncbi:predicted protein [Botrytis cinerea T4]|uniref:Uncharacterized protein n=1 Tax=Botryotinia fuckeliana (strain T4) TaxID=999810 RepID=G2YBB2_BOTF4|nr:predicted protein [Botrytis cinerea T4]